MRELVIGELRHRGYRVRESHVANELNLCCPFCVTRGKTNDQEFKLGINVRNGKAHCFRCGWRSRDALTQLKITTPIETPEVETKSVPVALPEDFELLDGKSTEYWMRRAVKYLLSRGVSIQQAKKHRIGFCMMGKFRGRVVFPIYDENKFAGYTARTFLPESQPKWLHSAGLKAAYTAGWRRKKEVILVEAVLDALVLERWLGGDVDVVALLGTHLSDYKSRWVEPYQVVTLWLDADHAGRKAAVEIASELHEQGRGVQLVQAAEDPSDLTHEEILLAYGARRRWTEGEGLSLLRG